MPGLKSKHNQANAIVQDMTLEEKARFCSGKNFWHLEASERHNLPPIMVTDGPHGLRKQNQSADHVGLNVSVPATCFPTACALASSWNPELLEQVGQAIGRECVAENVTVLLGPGVNIKRHPFCGRNFEYFSEDPLLTGKLAAALINGVQSQGIGTSIKHYAVNNQEAGRMYMDAIVDERTLREIYLRGFEIAIREAQPWTVMCAYNRVNGTYCSEHDYLLNTILRDEWGFEGLVVTDWGATNDRVEGIRTGLDLEMPGSGGINDALVEAAVAAGELKEADLDQAITRNVALSLLGADLAENIQPVDLDANHQLARAAAAECSVLLKNDDSLLPLKPGAKVAVIGEFAQKPRYQGAGSSQVNPTQLTDAWTTIQTYTDNATYAQGYDAKASELDEALIDAARSAAEDAEIAIVFAGLPAIYESEGFDRTHLNLPAQHDRLIAAVSAANPNTVVVLSNGSAVVMPWLDQVPAVLEGYLGGQAGGEGIADVLFGAAYPSGKLAETFPLEVTDTPSHAHFPGADRQMHYREGLFVGYRYFAGRPDKVQFPFGHGLSYTTFEYSELSASASQVSLTVANTGQRTGAEVIQVYARRASSEISRPEQELVGFTKVQLEPGASTRVDIALDERAFAHYCPHARDWLVESGHFQLRVGSSSTDIRLTGTVDVESTDTVTPLQGPTITDEGVVTDDATFASMLGKPVPAPEAVEPFHRNSSLQEVGTTFFGAKFKARVVEEFTRNMGGASNDPTLKKMFEEMANHMPLRALVLFGRGGMSYQQIDLLIALLNNKFLTALKLWWDGRA